MSIVFKHTIKNIFGKPLRTLVVTFSIFMCALSALLCFDLLTELKVQFKEMYTAVLGNADIILYHPMELTSDVPLNTSVGIITDTTYFYKDIEGEYNYAHGQSVSLYSFDFEAASEMGIYRRYVPEDGEVVLSARFAREFGYSVGDPIEMLDSNDEKHMMTVGEILPPDSLSIFESGYSAIMNGNTMTEFAGSSRAETTLLFIDVLDNSQVGDMVDAIEDISPGANYEVVSDMDELNEMMDQVTAVMFLIFAVSILLVVFVTFSICEKIISERMSVVGTLRSLGLSNRRTAIVLLLENVCYALMGSIPAIVLYLILRDPMMSTLFQTTNGYGEAVETVVHPISVLVVAGVVAGCILVECVLPLKAVLSATGTPIRDIIFDNRDTAYVLKKRSVITGCIFLAVTVVLGIFHKNLYCVVGFVVTTVVTLALLTPVIISGVSKGLQKIFQKTGNMSWELASREMRARKSTVGSAVLCATSAAICVTILAYGLETLDNFIPPVYDCDAIIDISTEGDKLFYVENLDGVSDVEYSYVSYMEILVNGEKDDNSTVKGMPDGGFRMVHEYSGLPDSLPAGTIAVRSEYARKYKLDTGDTLTLTVDPDGIFPLEREFVITCLYDMTGGYKSDNVFIIGMDDFEDIFGDEPSTIYVRCSDPQGVIDTVEKYSSMYTGYYTMTIEDYIEETNGEADPVITGLIVIIVIGAGMTCIGTASNQIIGFEGRKRECAVMLSTSMNKKKLSGILFKEVLIASFVSSVAGCFSGILLVKAVNSAFEDMGLLSFTSAEVKPVLLFTLVLALVFTLTVLFPIGHLRKMQLSEQLKYE